MSEAQGPNIGMLQAMDQHQDQQGEKSGFGLGHSDSIATITDGMKWLLNFHEGAIAAYNNVFEGLVSGSSLVTLFGKSGNMFGLKILEKLTEFFGGGGEDGGGEGGAPQDEGDAQGYGQERPDPSDYDHTNEGMAQSGAGLGGAHDDGDHHPSQSFDPGPSPSHGDDHGPALGG